MGLGDGDMDALRQAAEFHDVGIVAVPGNLLSLKRHLNERELEMVRKHPYWGAKMLEGVPDLEIGRQAILEHHEHFDGSGYPNGLRGGDISLPARILALAEYYDSVVSERPYRPGIESGEALHMVRAGMGTLFDPEVVRAFTES
jgi:HD-GYP domain-containing protein (c-di-GMP phosphodiesterase class II)